jgi:phosphoglycolate phosphatase
MSDPIHGVLFDKDGTLFDFEATWNAWAATMLTDLAAGDSDRAAALGARMGYDFAAQRFAPDSVVIAGTPDDILRLLLPGVPELTPLELTERLNSAAARAPQAEAVPLSPLIARLRGMGLKLGVATNDAEAPARAHLAGVGHEESFDFIAGYDSGFGGKPAPGMCLGFTQALGLAPASVLMVGDSAHDLLAGRAAGMRAVAVLTGMATRTDLAPLADYVLKDIGELPGLIEAL